MSAELIARLEAAKEGSFALDKQILAALGFTWRGMAYWNSENEMWSGPSAFTRSLDAALALAERVLPGEEWMIVGSAEGGETSFHALIGPDSLGRAGEAASAALALVIAVLRAKQ